MSSPVVAQNLTDDEVRVALEQVRGPDVEVRVNQAEALGRRGSRQRDRITPVLRELLRSDPEWRVRASAGRAIGRLATRDAVPDLVRALRDPVVDVRIVAAAALWRLPDPAAVPALVELLRDADANARQWAALALGMTNDSRATEPLVGILRDPEAAVRLDVIRSLGRIRDASATAPLEDFVRQGNRPIEERLEAVSSIASLQGPQKMESLVRLLESPSREVRARVVSALGDVGDALAIPALRRRRGSEPRPLQVSIDEAITEIEERARTGAAPVAPHPG